MHFAAFNTTLTTDTCDCSMLTFRAVTPAHTLTFRAVTPGHMLTFRAVTLAHMLTFRAVTLAHMLTLSIKSCLQRFVKKKRSDQTE
jgi:hypothetical protein